MAISRTTRTHLLYQFIILSLLFFGIGYELLPDRKFVLYLSFVLMFFYQLFILSCWMELLPVPRWMNFCYEIKQTEMETEETKTDSVPSSPITFKSSNVVMKTPLGGSSTPLSNVMSTPLGASSKPLSNGITKTPLGEPADITERIPQPRRWEKSTVNLGASPKLLTYQKSKSWMNLSESTKSIKEISLSREGSLDIFTPKSEIKMRSTSKLNKAGRANYKEERANKVKSWRPDCFSVGEEIATYHSANETASSKQSELAGEARRTKPPFLRIPAVQQEESESELSKSYSFPFRQKRFETWLEMKETETRASNLSLDMPYWKTMAYGLAVKYEARRRRRAISSPTKFDSSVESQLHTSFLHNSVEIQKDSKASQKKISKTASNYMNKIKMSFSNILSKKKGEEPTVISNKALKPSFSFKSTNRTTDLYKPKVEEKAATPGRSPYLVKERPLYYPNSIPFEKERFESDVQQKMVELSEEHTGLHRFNTK